MGDDRRIKLTMARVRDLAAPAKGFAVYHDTACPRLAVLVTSKGAKTFYRIGRIEGRPTRYKLGRFPEVTVENARDLCLAASAAVASGRNPQAERHAAAHEHTLQGLFDWWLENARARKKTWGEDERQFRRHLKAWGSRRLSTISRADVQALHARMGSKHGPYAANRLLALLRAMFNASVNIGYNGSNPSAGIKKFPESKRDRFLRAEEIPRFFSALAQEPNGTLRDFFTIALLTGARRSNVQAMRWEEIDWGHALWRIPETKAGRPVVVPLVQSAVAVLEGRRKTANGSPWVFPSHGRTGHICEPKSAWKRICKRAGLDDLRPHDVRRTLGSWMAMTGAGLPIVGAMLGHTQPQTTAIYARLTVDPVRSAAEAAVAAIEAAKQNGADSDGPQQNNG